MRAEIRMLLATAGKTKEKFWNHQSSDTYQEVIPSDEVQEDKRQDCKYFWFSTEISIGLLERNPKSDHLNP